MPKQCVSVDRWAGEIQQVVLVDPENTEDRQILRVGEDDVEQGDLDHYKEDKFYDEGGEEVEPPEKEQQEEPLAEDKIATLQKRQDEGEELTQEEKALLTAEKQRVDALEKSESLPQIAPDGSQSTPAADVQVAEGGAASQPPADRDGGDKGEGPAVDGSANQGGNVG